MQEWQQFTQLVRLSYGRLLDAALASREIGAEQFVLWAAALLSTPTTLHAIRSTSAYEPIHIRHPEFLVSFVLSDRLFFVAWSMLVALLLVSVLWDGLLPDRTDQHVLGVLPIRPRTITAARLAATLTVVTSFLAAINVPAAILHAVGCGVDPVFGSMPVIIVTQVLVCTLAGLFIVAVMLLVRVALVLLVSASAAARVALLLQLVTVIALVEAFLFLPGLLRAVPESLVASGAGDSMLPPAWFFGLYGRLTGPHAAALAPLATRAVFAEAAAAALVVCAYLASARLIARRTMEARVPVSGAVMARMSALVARGLLRDAPSRAIFGFIVIGVTRSRRHMLTLASYLGMGIAMAGVSILTTLARHRSMSLASPTDDLIALPLVLIYFLVLGLDAAFVVPTDIGANWIFRLTAARSAVANERAIRAAVFAFIVGPVCALVLAIGLWHWGAWRAVSVALMVCASGMALAEWWLLRGRAIPFTRAYAVMTSSLRVGVPLALFGLSVFAFTLDDVQALALAVPGGAVAYVAAMCVAIGIARQRRHPAATLPLTFDAPIEHEVLALHLERSGTASS